MDFLGKIKRIRELERKKYVLERELMSINEGITEEKETCMHISVNLGNYGFYPVVESKYRCLICGKGEGNEYFSANEYIVHAEDYLPQYDISDFKQCNNKFSFIQTIAIGLLKDNPDMSREEWVDKLNSLIQLSIEIRESDNSQKLIKSRIPRK